MLGPVAHWSIMPLKSMLKGWVMTDNSQYPTEKDSRVVVTESLIMELECQIREAEHDLRERERQEKRRETGVDYSWLVNRPTKNFDITQMERLELEELCSLVKPEECGRVISNFRDGLLRQPPLQDYPRIMKTVIRQVLETRPKEETMTEKVKKSLTKIRPGSRIAPVTEDASTTKVENLGIDIGNNSETSSQISSTGSQNVLFKKTIEDLPV